jgi:predicted molibdopterin-dependent oxidoreductase YjgC
LPRNRSWSSFGEEFRGEDVENLVAWGLKRGNVRFAYLGDHSNSRGAADMGLFPDLLPGYVPVSAPGAFAEYPNLPASPGKTLPQMLEAAANGELGALLVVGANPASRAGARSGRAQEHVRRRAGSFPHGNSGAGRCGSAGRQSL